VDVLIEDNRCSVGDDCISVKAGRDADAWRIGQPSENIVIRNIQCNSSSNAICIGSEMSGGVRNVHVENVSSPKSGNLVSFKANLDRGGVIRDVVVKNASGGEMKGGFCEFTNNYHSWRGGHFPTLFQNITVSGGHGGTAKKTAISAVGLPDQPLRDVLITDVTVDEAATAKKLENTANFVLTGVVVNGKPVTNESKV
jgi:polygalacturonase